MQCTTDDHCGEEPPSSTANRLILLMDRLARDGHLRYVALYHEVKETTLLAISKAAEKNWKKEVQKAPGTTEFHCSASICIRIVTRALVIRSKFCNQIMG